jgi:uncharacterized protein (TIGR02265 family)
MIRVKGSVLISRLDLVREIGGEEALERILSRSLPDDSGQLKHLLASSWYPFDISRRLDMTIVEQLGGGRTDFFEQLGASSAEKNLNGVHRALLCVGDPHRFLERTPRIYRFYYDQGRRDYEKVGPREAVLTTYDAETFSEGDCATVVGWYKRALQMCGAGGVSVTEEECRARHGNVCRYRITWIDPA